MNECDFDLIFYAYKDDNFIPKYEDAINKTKNDFILILIDKKNKEGNNFLSILKKNKNLNYNLIKEKITNNKNIKRIKQKEKEESQKEKEKKNDKEKQTSLGKEKKKENQKIIHPPYGIPNFGNTCYFNSVNQIILNLPIINDLLKEKEKVIKYCVIKYQTIIFTYK